MSDVKYPQVKVSLLGQDGNAFTVLGICNRAVKEAYRDDPQEASRIKAEFQKEAMSGDYDHLLVTVMQFFDVESTEPDVDEDDETCSQCGGDRADCLCEECGGCTRSGCECDEEDEEDWDLEEEDEDDDES